MAGGEAGKVTLCVSVKVRYRDTSKIVPVVHNKLYTFPSQWTWKDIFDDVVDPSEFQTDKLDTINLTVSDKLASGTIMEPNYDETIAVVHNFDKKLKYVMFEIERDAPAIQSDANNNSSQKNAFEVLMSRAITSTKKPPHIEHTVRFTEKDRLYNDIVDALPATVRFPTYMGDQTIRKQMGILSSTLWYLDGTKDRINERSKTSATVEPLPERFDTNFNGYNDWRGKKQKAPTLSAERLKQHSSSIFGLLVCPFTSQWGDFKIDLEKLAVSLSSYASYLEEANVLQQKRQSFTRPVREIGENRYLEQRPSTNIVAPKYLILDNIMSARDNYAYIFFDEALHLESPFKSRKERHDFLDGLKLSVPVEILRYHPGGSMHSYVILWRTQGDRNSGEAFNMSMKVCDTLKPLLPEYHTRQMKQTFVRTFCKLSPKVAIPPAILRAIYEYLTLDSSADQNKNVDERIRQGILSEDVDLIIDLRYLNEGRPSDTFQVFFEKLQRVVEEMTAVDERRHNTEHLSQFISIKHLINKVKEDLPEGTRIPSESTVLFSFVPKNSYSKISKLYKSTVPLQFKIQTRQLRNPHQDEHYCAALYKYMRQFAIKYREIASMLCVDDKAKVDFGEPGLAVSSGVRGKQSIVPVESNLSALDHDFCSKGSLTPSVCLNVEIPSSIEESFYRGNTTVSYKDSIFQPSNPWRHAVEMERIIKDSNDTVPPVLLVYSDGGPDHKVTYHAVKLALIVLFKKLDLDLLIAGRTAPGHSWLNPAERIMSILNLALQNVALTREECRAEIEKVLKSANSMKDIREKSAKVPNLKQSWLESVKPIVDTLTKRTEQLTLKDVPFTVNDPCTDEELRVFEEQIQVVVDGDIQIGQYQQRHLANKLDYLKFIQDHCRERTYIFQVRKCSNANCCTPRRNEVDLPWVPDPVLNTTDNQHYQEFETVLGTDTSEKDKPSNQKVRPSVVAEQMRGIRNAGLVAQNVRYTVKCYECLKPRCIYSQKKLSLRDLRALTRLLERHDYSCGASIVPDGQIGLDVSARLQMDCNTPVEFSYYAENNPVNVQKDICYHCAEPGAVRDNELKKQFRIVLPICDTCKTNGKTIPKRNPIK